MALLLLLLLYIYRYEYIKLSYLYYTKNKFIKQVSVTKNKKKITEKIVFGSDKVEFQKMTRSMRIIIEKKINVTFYQEPGEEFFLEVSNTAECKNLNMVNGKIETSKKDKDSHGIGLRSVRQAAQSIGGTLEITPREDLFTVTVRIPIKKQ